MKIAAPDQRHIGPDSAERIGLVHKPSGRDVNG
jgi:hypothetical protein